MPYFCILCFFVLLQATEPTPPASVLARLALTQESAAIDSLPGWGYSYGDLLFDLGKWTGHPNVTIDSIGVSVENRTIWKIIITDTSVTSQDKMDIALHNRTHPLEVQSGWVLGEMIEFLLTDDSLARALKANYVYHIVPMLNPDGVEAMEDCAAGFGRCNRNGEDLERQWDLLDEEKEPEVYALKTFYQSRMESENPFKIMLNMHSAFGCLRYFWYHEEAGTSAKYALMQQNFINTVQSFYPEGIQSWFIKTSWASEAPTYYPESWFWYQYGEEVLALTYEHTKYCDDESAEVPFKSGMALLRGMDSFLREDYPSPLLQTPFAAAQNFVLGKPAEVYDLKGRLIATTKSLQQDFVKSYKMPHYKIIQKRPANP